MQHSVPADRRRFFDHKYLAVASDHCRAVIAWALYHLRDGSETDGDTDGPIGDTGRLWRRVACGPKDSVGYVVVYVPLQEVRGYRKTRRAKFGAIDLLSDEEFLNLVLDSGQLGG